MGKRMVSGLTLLFLKETPKRQENSGTISNGGAMPEYSVITETKKDVEIIVEIEEKHVIMTTQDNVESCSLMPLHYPLFKKEEYEDMPEWKLNQLFTEYGLISVEGDLDYKRKFAMGAFLWPPSWQEPELSPIHDSQESSPKSKKAKITDLLCRLLGFA